MSRGLLNRCVERGDTQRLPKKPGHFASLVMALEQLEHAYVLRGKMGAHLQKEARCRSLLQPSRAAREQQAAKQIEWRGERQSFHAEVLRDFPTERKAQDGRIGAGGQRNKAQGFTVGANQNVQAIVENDATMVHLSSAAAEQI